jgi:hypothetical protein
MRRPEAICRWLRESPFACPWTDQGAGIVQDLPNGQGTPFMAIVVCAGFAAVILVGSTHTGDHTYRECDSTGSGVSDAQNRSPRPPATPALSAAKSLQPAIVDER